MKKYDKVIPKYKLFNIDWLMGTICNYNCSYCSPLLHDGKHKFIDIEIAKKFLLKLKKEIPDKDLIFIISGGEPTLWSGLAEFMEVAKKNDIEMQLITNGSRSVQWWDDNANNIDLLIVSFHWEYANPAHLENVCKMLRNKHNTHVKVNVLVMPEKIDESYELAERLEKNVPGILIELRPIRPQHGMYLIEYTDEQLERLKEKNRFGRFHEQHRYQLVYTDKEELLQPDLAVLKGENCYKGWECCIGLESLKISYDGTVMRGNCDFGNSLGNISGEIKFPKEPVICDRDFCKCVTDIRVSKRRIV